jgi:hypothetical protein
MIRRSHVASQWSIAIFEQPYLKVAAQKPRGSSQTRE